MALMRYGRRFGRNNVVERSHVESALYAVYTVKFSGHFAEFLGVHDFEKLVKLRAQPAFLGAFSLERSPGSAPAAADLFLPGLQPLLRRLRLLPERHR